MVRASLLAAAVAVGLLLAWFAGRLPAPAPADAPAGAFSAERAMADVRALSATPRPTGSPEAARARDHLLARAAALGLQTQVQRGVAVQGRGFGEAGGALAGGTVENVLARLPGRGPAAAPLLLMAHYDSVPGSPGAADDAMGSAALLEVARAMRAGPAPLRDVWFLWTDGEEAGLLGARLFFAQHPLARRLGLVVNLEARGSSGPALMFETGARNGALIDLYGQAAAQPAANSLTGFVYRNLPNDTDFTLARRAGLAGLNIATLADQQDYHSPSSTPETLDRGSLQHMGDQTLAAAQATAVRGALPPRTENAVYFDVFGLALARYPAWGGWLVLGAAAALWAWGTTRARRGGAAGLADIGRGAAALPFLLCSTALALMLARLAIPASGDLVGLRPILVQFGLYETGAALIAGGVALAAAAGLMRGGLGLARLLPLAGGIGVWVASGWSGWLPLGLGVVGTLAAFAAGRRRPGEMLGLWSGLLLALLWIAAATQIYAPEAAFVFAWPALASAIGLALWPTAERAAGWRRVAAAVPGVVAFGALASFGHLLLVSLGAETPAALSLIALLAAVALAPALLPAAAVPGLGRAGVVVALLGAAAFVAVAARTPWSARSPAASQIVYLADPAARGYARVGLLRELDPWSGAALRGDGGEPTRRPLPELLARQAWVAPARPVAATAPQVVGADGPDGAGLLIQASGARELRLVLNAERPMTAVEVGGVRLPWQGRTLRLRWTGAAPLTVTVPGLRASELRGSVTAIRDGWPSDARPLPARPEATGGWGTTDALATVRRF